MIAVIIAAATILPGLKQVRAPSLLTGLGNDTDDVKTGYPCNPCNLGAGGIASLGGSSNVGGPVMAQNMTGGNTTGGNMTGGNATEGNTTGSISSIWIMDDDGADDTKLSGDP